MKIYCRYKTTKCNISGFKCPEAKRSHAKQSKYKRIHRKKEIPFSHLLCDYILSKLAHIEKFPTYMSNTVKTKED